MKKLQLYLEIEVTYMIPFLLSFLIIGYWTFLILLLCVRIREVKE
jgi:hypothetical protein